MARPNTLITFISTSEGADTQNLGLGSWKYIHYGEMSLKQIEQGFASFFTKKIHFTYVMIFHHRISRRKALFNLP